MEQMMEFMKGPDWSPLLISLKTGVVATILSFFGGIYAARQVVKAGPKTKAVMDGILTLPMVLPPTVAGFFLLLIFSVRRPFGAALYGNFGIKVVQTWLGCILAATVIAFPLMYRNARAAFEQVDANLVYAARTLGMSEIKIFWKVVIPSAGPGILSGTILTFARAMGEYGNFHAGGKYSGKDRDNLSEDRHGYPGWRLWDRRFLGRCDHADCFFCGAGDEPARIR